MERLTGRMSDGTACVNGSLTARAYREAIDRLAHYEDLEEQGRLVVLPCKVGDTVYGCFARYSRTVIECKVVKIRACQFSDGSTHHIVDVEFYIPNPYFDDGRLMLHGHQAVVSERYGNWDMVFLTHEEAETALRKEDA